MRRNKMKRTAKVDLSITDEKEFVNMISLYQQKRTVEVPLHINDKLTIMVAPENCNEQYRQKYIKYRLK